LSGLCILREEAVLLETLAVLMAGAGLSELKSPLDVVFMKTALYVGVAETEAVAKFKRLMSESIADGKRGRPMMTRCRPCPR
jgi:hypothetical protein